MVAAQIVGLDGIPWPCKTMLSNGILTIHRNNDVSGRLLVPVVIDGFGELLVTSGTLPERAEPYLLDLELARGALSRIRNQVSIWREGGLKISADFETRLEACVVEFSHAVFQKTDDSERTSICELVLDRVVDLMFEITDEFSRQIASIHNSQPQTVPVIAGTVFDRLDTDAGLNTPPELTDLAVQKMIQPRYSASDNGDHGALDFGATGSVIDWLSAPGADTVRLIGPLFQFDNIDLPDWMPPHGNFEDRLESAKYFCRRFGAEYQKRIKILHVTSGISGVGHQHFNYPQQLQMTMEMLEALDQVMPNTSMMVSFDQPWGERLSMATGGVAPMEIADSLLRYGARISAIGLEFNLDYWPQGTLMRDPLQWVDLVDRWAHLGLPLVIYLSAPVGMNADEQPSRFHQTIRNSTDLQGYQRYLATVINLLVRRPAVNVVAWRRTVDSDNARFPFSGLADQDGAAREFKNWYGKIVDDIMNPATGNADA